MTEDIDRILLFSGLGHARAASLFFTPWPTPEALSMAASAEEPGIAL
jgi:hypothetical protein